MKNKISILRVKKIVIIILIIFWISGYFWIWKILEIKEKYEDKKMIEKISKDLKSWKLFGKDLDELFIEKDKKDKIKKRKEEEKRLSATTVSYSDECQNERNTTLWQNKIYWFKMCIPSDYMWYSTYTGRFIGEVYDETEAVWIEDNMDRWDLYFSPIWINEYKKPYKVKIDSSKQFLFETKTHIIIFDYNKKNKEHLEAIKSLKLYDKNKKIILSKEFLERINKKN